MYFVLNSFLNESYPIKHLVKFSSNKEFMGYHYEREVSQLLSICDAKCTVVVECLLYVYS